MRTRAAVAVPAGKPQDETNHGLDLMRQGKSISVVVEL